MPVEMIADELGLERAQKQVTRRRPRASTKLYIGESKKRYYVFM
jgi:hypothetical protein